jgi:hypothetical protein
VPEPLEKLKALYEDWGDGDYTGHAEFFHPGMTTETFGMGTRSGQTAMRDSSR